MAKGGKEDWVVRKRVTDPLVFRDDRDNKANSRTLVHVAMDSFGHVITHPFYLTGARAAQTIFELFNLEMRM